MTAVLLRLAVYAIIAGLLYFGIRRILLDWRNRFRDLDKKTRERDLNERERPDVIDLKKDKDGVFRPGARKNKDQ